MKHCSGAIGVEWMRLAMLRVRRGTVVIRGRDGICLGGIRAKGGRWMTAEGAVSTSTTRDKEVCCNAHQGIY